MSHLWLIDASSCLYSAVVVFGCDLCCYNFLVRISGMFDCFYLSFGMGYIYDLVIMHFIVLAEYPMARYGGFLSSM